MEGFRRTLKGFDRDLGKLLDGLRELGVEQNTLVIFTGDNGPNPLYDTTSRVRTAGLRGQKWSLYEGGTREPFIVRWPGHVPSGRVNDTAVLASVDVFPTLCALVGVAPPAEVKFDGENAENAWLGKPWTRTGPLLWEYGRTTSYLQPKGAHDRSPNVAIREGDWKLLVNADGSGAELYDLKADPRETKNVAQENSAIAERLKQSALAWRKSLP
jgi:arylsulfatase A-like enzyme